MADKAEEKKPVDKPKQPYVRQSDLPSRSLREALRVSQAITDNYAGGPTAPHDVAMALELSPTSSGWRELAAASLGYGLTKGSWNADRISLDTLGRRATAPTEVGDDVTARAETALRPKTLGAFFAKYNKAKFPPDHIAKNVLQQELHVPADRLDAALQIVKDTGQFAGFIRDTKTGPFVAVDDPQPRPVRMDADADAEKVGDEPEETKDIIPAAPPKPPTAATPAAPDEFKVFISHSKNMAMVEQAKDVLELYDIDYEIAVEEETTAIPVPAKVMASMRRCQAGIVMVTADEQNKTVDGYTINTNVLIEIGAAFVLYDQGVILVWDRRLKVPSNLQGLYRIDFEGAELSFVTGTRLAKAVKVFGRAPSPGSAGPRVVTRASAQRTVSAPAVRLQPAPA
jgi:predicted nucleotide-binding protein